LVGRARAPLVRFDPRLAQEPISRFAGPVVFGGELRSVGGSPLLLPPGGAGLLHGAAPDCFIATDLGAGHRQE
jgi:hypothetical protein